MVHKVHNRRNDQLADIWVDRQASVTIVEMRMKARCFGRLGEDGVGEHRCRLGSRIGGCICRRDRD